MSLENRPRPHVTIGGHPPSFEPPASRVRQLRTLFLDTVHDVLDPERPIVLVEFPDFGNVGDSALYLGELAALAELGLQVPRFVSGSRSWNLQETSRLVGDATILLHGGGDFGDLWPEHHARRLDLLRNFPRNPVVQLPQSLHFGSVEALAETRLAIQKHRAFQLLVRDRESERLASEELGIEPILCPDAAFVLGPQRPPEPATTPEVWLIREDHESHRDLPPGFPDPVDWTGQPYTPLRLAASAMATLRRHLPPSVLLRRLNQSVYRPLAEERFRRGLRLLSTGSVVVTDRLHGHILCLLLGIPHVLMDTRHGKLSSFHHAWTEGVSGVEYATHPEEARDLARYLSMTVHSKAPP